MRTRQRLHGVEHGSEVVRVIADKATASGLGRGKGQGGLGDGRSDRRMPHGSTQRSPLAGTPVITTAARSCQEDMTTTKMTTVVLTTQGTSSCAA